MPGFLSLNLWSLQHLPTQLHLKSKSYLIICWIPSQVLLKNSSHRTDSTKVFSLLLPHLCCFSGRSHVFQQLSKTIFLMCFKITNAKFKRYPIILLLHDADCLFRTANPNKKAPCKTRGPENDYSKLMISSQDFKNSSSPGIFLESWNAATTGSHCSMY